LRVVTLAACVAIAGCFSPSTVTCADGTTCPASKVCAPAGGTCVDPDQIAACDGLGEDANCTSSSIDVGVCQSSVCEATQWTATVVLGGSGLGSSVGLYDPQGVAVDRSGNVYIADSGNSEIRRLDTSGVITIVAGTGDLGFDGDGAAATSALLFEPEGVAVDGAGNLFIADTQNHRVRKVDGLTGTITTVAGTGVPGFSGDGVASAAELDFPSAVAVDGLGNVYISDTVNERIREVDTQGTITTIAGNGSIGFSGDGAAAIAAQLDAPTGIAVDAAGNVYFADTSNYRIRRVDVITEQISTVAGTCTGMCSPAFGGDGGPATSAQLAQPYGVAVDGAGNIFIADTFNQRIRKVDASGTITTLAGNGSAGSSGDGGPAISAELYEPGGVAVAAAGSVYIADSHGDRIRAVDATTSAIATIAGNGTNLVGGGAATSLPLNSPEAVRADALGDLYIADQTRVWIVDTSGVIAAFAGNGTLGYDGDGGPATNAELGDPSDVAIDSQDNIYIADTANNRIRRVDQTGTIMTVVGTGTQGFSGDGGPAIDAQLDAPSGIAFDAQGQLYFTDRANHRIRRVDSAGMISTIAGTGSAGFGGDGSVATTALLDEPHSLAFDSSGNLYVVDQSNERVRKIDTSGIITTFAGDGTATFGGDGGPATSASMNTPSGVTVDSANNVYVSDQGSHRIRKIDSSGIITTAVGMGMTSSDGDGGPASSATIDAPFGLATDAAHALYVTDADPERVRRVDANGTITTVAGPIDPQGMGPLAQARLDDPRALIVAPAFTLFAGGSSGTVQAATTSSLGVVAGRYPQNTPTGTLARFQDSDFGSVAGIAYDAAQNLIYLTESVSMNTEPGNRVLVVTITDPADSATWTIAPLANAAGTSGYSDGAAQGAGFRAPTGLYFDQTTRQLYVADTGNHAIRAIDLSAGIDAATVSTIAGTPQTRGFFGDGGPATSALLYSPQAITECSNGDLFVADTGNERVRRIAAGTNVITTVLGDGSQSSSGEGAPSSSFPIDEPQNLACDPVGNVFATSTTAVRMLLADSQGSVDGSGAVRTIYGLPPRDSFPSSVTRCLAGIAVLDATTVQVTDSCTGILVGLHRVTTP
jgi:sugar lactone lactonase YvrE